MEDERRAICERIVRYRRRRAIPIRPTETDADAHPSPNAHTDRHLPSLAME